MALPEEKASPSFTGSTRPLSRGVIKYLCLSLPKKSDKSDFYTRESAQGEVSVPRAMKTKPSLQAMGANSPHLPPPPRAPHRTARDSQGSRTN